MRRPDDWPLHRGDGAMLRAVLPHSARDFARAIIMPNLVPPVVTAGQARAYRDGGDLYGARLSLDWMVQGLDLLAPAGD